MSANRTPGLTVLLVYLLFFIFPFNVQAQSQNWNFGQYASVSFPGGVGVSGPISRISSVESCTSISNSAGELQFYSDGITVWNRNHEIMENGTGLLSEFTSSQGALAVQMPGVENIYYLFTVPAQNAPHGFHYSIIDMTMDGGLGAVQQKNVELLGGKVWEKLTAVKHCNGSDIWILVRMFGTNNYYSYLLTESGLVNSPVVSSVGLVIDEDNQHSLGVMKFSPDGRRLAVAHSFLDKLELIQFNPSTGQLFNAVGLSAKPAITTHPDEAGIYGLEFSQDGRFLYASSGYYLFNHYFLWQFDLNAGTVNDIQASRFQLDYRRNTNWGHLQLAPDGKIYIAEFEVPFLSTINSPMNAGAGAQFQYRSFSLGNPAIQNSLLGLPNFVQSYFYQQPTYDFEVEYNCMQLEARFEINFKYGYDSIRWDFGDPLSGVLNSSNEAIDTHVYTEIGIYHPRLFIYRCGESDTLQQRIWVGQVNTFLGNDTLLCVPGSLTLDATAPKPLATYQWNTGQTTPTIQVSSSGLYTVEVELAACIYTDEIVVSTAAYPQPFDLGSDRTICTGDSIQIGIQNPPAGYTYLWNDASLNPTLMVYSPGQYSLTVENPEGCTRSDTINIAETARPVFDLGPDREICEGESTALVIDAVSQSYLWNTGEVEKEIEVAVAGSYWALASNNGCDYSDTVNIVVNPIPTVSFERNYEVCGNSPLLLSPTFNPNHQIAWSNGSIAPALEVSQSGTYSFTVTNVYGCEYKDTAIVRFKEIPHFELVADTTLCEGNILSIGLNPQPGVNYLWNNGVSSSMNQISTSGLYWLELEQSGCRFRDSINVQFVLAPELSLGVDTTLCVGQSMILEQPDIQGFSPIWQDGSTGASYQVTVPGTYVLHLQNGGCVLSDTVTVAYADSPQILAPFSFPICPGEEIQIKPSLQASSLPVNYLWSNGSTDSTLTISNPGVYRVRVGNSCGFQEADIQVKDGICRLFVPSAFTPNGDGRNDVFRAVGHSNIEKFKLEVFNRWGQVVFSSENISEGWDGRLSGVLQSNDVYVWQIIYSEVGENQPRKLKGTVTLIR